MKKTNLKQCREAQGLKLEYVAELCNIPCTIYKSWEDRTRLPDTNSLIILSDFFHISIDFILNRS